MEDRGLGTVSPTAIVCNELRQSLRQNLAESGAVDAATVQTKASIEAPEGSGTDPALILLIEVWNELPVSAKAQILTVVDAVKSTSGSEE
jgi:hypothetical protein